MNVEKLDRDVNVTEYIQGRLGLAVDEAGELLCRQAGSEWEASVNLRVSMKSALITLSHLYRLWVAERAKRDPDDCPNEDVAQAERLLSELVNTAMKDLRIRTSEARRLHGLDQSPDTTRRCRIDFADVARPLGLRYVRVASPG
jgi:hypothetical protein